MKNQKGFSSLIGIVIIVVLAVVAVGGIYLYNYLCPNGGYGTCYPTKPVTVVDQTAGWKTYRNTQLGYSFQYPQELITFTGAENKTDDYIFGACDSQHNFCIYTNVVRINQASFEDYIAAFKSVNSKNIIKTNPNTISGKSVVTIEEETGSEKGIFTFINFGYPLVISLTVGGKDITDADTNYADFQEISNKIISTFKFTK